MTTSEAIQKPSFVTGATYNTDSVDQLKPGVYLGLFHGRKTPDEQLDGWGENGPVIGPLAYVHTTYLTHIRFCPVGEDDPTDLNIIEDMVEFDGMYYGDWTVFFHNPDAAAGKDVIHTCKLALDALTTKYENGVGVVDAEKALHAFGNLKDTLAKAELQ